MRVSERGKVTEEYLITEDGEHVLGGGSNTIEIKDGRVRMKDADCPDRICMRQGWIERSGEAITCLPNRIVVEVAGEAEDIDVVI